MVNVQYSAHPLAVKIFDEELKRLIFKASKRFNRRRSDLLNERQVLKAKRFIPQINSMTEGRLTQWKVAPIPERLQQRRVEITGPANNTKLVIQMLSANEFGDYADTAMIDFEDSMKPSFENVLSGYINCMGAVKGDLQFFDKGKEYKITSDRVYPMIRIRGLHLDESNILVDNEPTSAGLMDLVITSYLTHRLYRERGMNPKYYIPKCETPKEARFWNDVLSFIENELKLDSGEIKVSLLIETYPAACTVEEILCEVKEHAVALNVGRWDKIFSDIKVFAKSPDHVFRDRSLIGLNCPWMENYAKRVIKICHRHGALAIGGMAAFTPGKTEDLRYEQNNKVLNDKKLESSWGHDGCWVSHPYFITSALSAFPKKNQLDYLLEDFDELQSIEPQGGGPYTFNALRQNIRVGIYYLYYWNKDIGCIALDNLMEDLATLEISRAQVWQWHYHKVVLDNHKIVTTPYLKEVFDEVEKEIFAELKDGFGVRRASEMCFEIFTEEKLRDFLVLENEIYDEGDQHEYELRPTL
ncbi:MAG TPA: hypothetical protein VKZ84_02250 [Bacteriovoracaceae bacterium]|nr:hypothetical protein [Bacteriovoracaceae bacterium]